MSMLAVRRLHPEAKLPTRAYEGDAGFDLYALEDVPVYGSSLSEVRTGIAVEIPPGHVGLVLDRSSVAKKHLKVVGGVIDSGYRGEIIVLLYNLAPPPVSWMVRKGDKIAQLVVCRLADLQGVREVKSLSETERGGRGFGSSG